MIGEVTAVCHGADLYVSLSDTSSLRSSSRRKVDGLRSDFLVPLTSDHAGYSLSVVVFGRCCEAFFFLTANSCRTVAVLVICRCSYRWPFAMRCEV